MLIVSGDLPIMMLQWLASRACSSHAVAHHLIRAKCDSCRGEGRPMQQGRFDGGAARRQQYLAQRGRGRGQVRALQLCCRKVKQATAGSS